ncbi:MAG: hypothetical protein NDF55_01670 [archaeon GB-1867-005]|nr:hypothetical protein [Candidatus Culexmicrobium cathedralense]
MKITKIFTPGHGLFMDTLIMYGLFEAISSSNLSCELEGLGGLFCLSVNADIDVIGEALANAAWKRIEETLDLLINRARVVMKSSKRGLEGALKSICDKSTCINYLERLLKPGHADREGRGSKGTTVWLPLSPYLGKYLTGEYKYLARRYAACPQCIAAAALGASSMMIPVTFRRRTNMILLTFDGEILCETMNVVRKFIHGPEMDQAKNELSRHIEDLPLSTFTNLIITLFSGDVVVALADSNASWRALSTTFEIVKVPQIRGYEEISIDPVIDALKRIYVEGEVGTFDALQIIVRRLARLKDIASLDALFRYLFTRRINDLYMFARLASGTLDRGLGVNLCKELVKLAVA